MRFEGLCRPKARDLSVPPDDVLLHLPGRVTAVFDGASDAEMRQVDGVPYGRAAALAAARATAALPDEAVDWPAARILSELSAAVGRCIPADSPGGPASTTAILALETGEGIRLVGLGDSGYRLNGGPVENTDLMPDRASVAARLALFARLSQSRPRPEAEALSQRFIGLGLGQALSEGALDAVTADAIIDEAIRAAAIPGAEDEIVRLLTEGLRSQFRLANNPDARLGYGILNGTEPLCASAVDRLIPRRDLGTLELFSDGYLSAPGEPTIAAWEAEHARLEARDPYHLETPAAVKGSTETRVFDDRTVAILSFGPRT